MYTDLNRLLKLYEGCTVYHGEMHDHSNSGGTSDGKRTLSYWREAMERLEIDFAAILDHRQVRHMYEPEWEDGLFVAGTEPGTCITDSRVAVRDMHYLILVPHRDIVAQILDKFPEYEFSGGTEGHFVYPTFTRERFGELIDTIKSHGGFFVHPHPKLIMKSEDPCEYWFRDETGIEVFYRHMESEYTEETYQLWVELLKTGKRVWACAACDEHCEPSVGALTTIYGEEKSSASYLSHLRRGDFTCGPVGIRMCIGETPTGGICSFGNQELIVAIGDFHPSVQNTEHQYRVDIFADENIVYKLPIDCNKMNVVKLPVENVKYYRAEVIDETRGLRIAIGNPIWNSQK